MYLKTSKSDMMKPNSYRSITLFNAIPVEILECGVIPYLSDLDVFNIIKLCYNYSRQVIKTPYFKNINIALTCDIINFVLDTTSVFNGYYNDVQDVNYNTPLHYCETGKQTKRLLNSYTLDKKRYVNLKDRLNKTCLHYAETAEQTRMLIESKADVNVKEYYNHNTPLHYSRSTLQTKLLVEAKADVNAVESFGCATPLHVSFSASQTKILLDAKADVNIVDGWGSTPLHECENADQAKILIEYKANINSVDFNGSTPLHKVNNIKHCRVLLSSAGDKVNKLLTTKDNFGGTPLHYTNNLQLCKEFLRSYKCSLSKFTNFEHVNPLVLIKNYDGRTPLHSAIITPEKTQLLIDEGANIHSTDNIGNTPLHRAKNLEVIKILLHSKAFVDSKNIYGNTPLHLAKSTGKVKLLMSLYNSVNGISLKKLVNIPNAMGNTPLHIFSIQSYAPLVKIIMKSSLADITIRNSKGHTPLHISRTEEQTKMMLDNFTGCKKSLILSKDIHGNTPLHYSKNADQTKILLSYLDNPNEELSISNDVGHKPFDYATDEDQIVLLSNRYFTW